MAAIQQCLSASLIDEMHLAISPVLLGAGERLFAGVDMVRLGCECSEHVSTPSALHVVLRKKRPGRPNQAPQQNRGRI
ncbi:MAG: dihydrofolate reductase family protein [Planctomycetia bacterium]